MINISSIIASTGFSGLSVYAATKSSLIGFSKSLARELGKAGITVNIISPGYMETEMTKGLDDAKIKKNYPPQPDESFGSARGGLQYCSLSVVGILFWDYRGKYYGRCR